MKAFCGSAVQPDHVPPCSERTLCSVRMPDPLSDFRYYSGSIIDHTRSSGQWYSCQIRNFPERLCHRISHSSLRNRSQSCWNCKRFTDSRLGEKSE